ncbi:MAG TPA: hypothetical protein VKY39_06950, partial [Aggregatilineales bacterium]|nr:hypothetical protein [Aggregatilineales bacterium]
ENVNWRDFTWATAHDEALPLDTATIRIEASDLETALLRGEVDAILTPEIPSGDAFVSGCRRLYGSRAKEIEQRLLLDQRYAPIVHLLVAQRSVLERCPRLEQSLTRVFSRAYDIAWERYNDPAWSLQFWGRQEFEQQRNLIGRDCWSQGLEPNSRALRDFCDAAADQGIIGHVPALSDLFA